MRRMPWFALLGALLQVTVICTNPQLAGGADARKPRENGLPRVFLVDAEALAETKRRVAAGDKELAPALAKLQSEADGALKSGPFSVVNKTVVPPSGDKHDYVSMAPYWWPNPATADGKPYLRRDGEVNPIRGQHDNVPLAAMCHAVDTLALAYYLTGQEPYAEHAAELLRGFFVDEATRMNPNLEFGQAIPGRCEGRAAGIIDTAGLVRLVDSVGMLAGSPSWTEADQKALEGWFGSYLQWMLHSQNGQSEARAANNHGTWYDVQVASYALFVGQTQLAKSVLSQALSRRIASQIEPDGRQPRELVRTKSFDYSTMNLYGMFDLATLGQRVGVDLWNFQTEDGRNIRNALDWMLPYATGRRKWEHKQIKKLQPARFFGLLRRAAIAYHQPRYEQLIVQLADMEPGADRMNLLYPRATP